MTVCFILLLCFYVTYYHTIALIQRQSLLLIAAYISNAFIVLYAGYILHAGLNCHLITVLNRVV